MADQEPLNHSDSKTNGQVVIIPVNGVNSNNKDDNSTIIMNGKSNGILNDKIKNEKELSVNGFSNHNNENITITKKQLCHKEPPDGSTRGWTIMISAFLCNGIIFGVINTYSIFHSYFQKELASQNDKSASSKAALVGSLTIGTTFLLSPVAGMLTDKIGLRLTTLIGGVFCAGGMLLSSFFTHSIEALYFTYGIMFGLGAALAYTPTLAILGHYFKRYLGKVSGFVTAGSSIFTIILPPVLDYLVKNIGIQSAFKVLSAVSAFIIVCSIVYKPLHPPPEPPKKKPGRSAFNMLLRSIVNVEIWKKKRYVIWTLCVPLALFGYFVPYVHMVKFIESTFKDVDNNLPVMCIGISSGVGRLIFGILADLPGVNRIFLQQISLAGIGILTMLLPSTNSYTILLVIALIMGLFDGCFISLLGPIAFEICGPQGATQAIGFLLGLSSIPLTVGPPIAGIIFDQTGSYTLPLILAGIPPIVGASVMFLIRCVRDDDNCSEKEMNNLPLAKQNFDEESKTEGNVQNGNVHLINSTKTQRKGSLESTGDFGRYQAFQFFLHVLSALTAGLHMLSLVTVAAVPEHRCYIDGIDTNESHALWNSSSILSAIPIKNGALDSCHMYDNENHTVPCTSYVYDTTYYKSSRTIEWNLVCDKRWMGAIAQTIYMLGTFTGAVILGGLADKVGRKTVFCWSAVFQLIIGVGVAFTPEYFSFLVLRYLYGIFGSAGSYITGFVLTMELVGSSRRTVCGISFQAVFAVGIMLVAAWGAIIPDRKLLQIVYGLHGLCLIGHWWIMDESPRWLWMQGRAAEAVDIVTKGLRINGSGIKVNKDYYVAKRKAQAAVAEESTAGLSDLFKTPNLKMKTLNVCLCWFANSLTYYGLSLSAGKLYGDPYLILFIMGLVEFPSYIVIVMILDRLGRRPITSTLMLAGGICCICAAFIAQGSIAATSIVMMGKLFIAGSFAVIYNYSAELFPTVVRNSAMGLGSMCARLSSALTPLITLLDSFDPKIPAVLFGTVCLLSGIWVMFLPETMNQPMPESIADGELFGKGDTWFAACCGKKKSNYNEEDGKGEEMISLKMKTANL